jgi:hypothetical protein
MACASSISNFLAQSYAYQDAYFTTVELGKWVSYQSYRSPYYGTVPVSLVVTQWGLETGWNNGCNCLTTYYNPGNQASGCGWCVNRTMPNGLPGFCDLSAGIHAYAQLLIQGYRHVASAYADYGLNTAAQALGQGYETGYSIPNNFCGGPATISQSTPRIWAASHYGAPAGSDIYNTIAANTCLSDLNYVQSNDPNLPYFANIW